MSQKSEKPLTISSCALSEKAMEERELEGDHLVVVCRLAGEAAGAIPSHALVSSGAASFALVDENFARRHLPLIPLKNPAPWKP